MNISNNWWAANCEDGVFIWDQTAIVPEGTWHATPGGDWISNRNFAGRIAVINNFQTVRFMSSAFVQTNQATLTAAFDGNYGVVACNSNFYTIVNYNGNFIIRQYDDVGTYTTQTWTITGNYERNHGAVLNDSTFYWSNDDTILAWDLGGNVALPNLVTLTGFRASYILATADSRIAVIWINNITNEPSRLSVYNTDGSVFLQTDYVNSELISLSLTLNWDSGILWAARRDPGPFSFMLKLDYSGGIQFTVLSILQTPGIDPTFPPNAEFGAYPLVEGVGQLGGMYKLIKDMTHDEVWTGTSSWGTVKRPDPSATTALFGDEP